MPLHEIDAPSLLETIEQVARAASRDESRPVLTGILVRFEGDKLMMAATDSYRLSVKETELGEPGPSSRRSSPRARSRSSRASAAGADDDRRSACTRTTSSSAPTTSWLTTRRIDGQFPNFKQLLPETFEVEVELAARASCSTSSAAPR